MFVLPASEIPVIGISFVDKIAHFLIHSILSFIWLWYSFLTRKGLVSVITTVLVLSLCFSYGVLIEALQKWFLPSRNFDLLDLLANGFGVVFGMLMYRAFSNKFGKDFLDS
jgi:VanZ family protein